MSLLLQSLLVAAAVAACTFYSVWRLLSLNARLRTIEALGVLPAFLTAPWLAALRTRTLARLATGCAGCAAGSSPDAAAHRSRTPGALRR
ncbi:MAG TPA: hypothetical protein VET46_08460 [Steroidobacteraceae bacterium]|nr:hypothetical protein [Steroidobacteraceae bacterium]